MGAVRGYLEVPHDKKWIRWSSHQEWYELYCDDHADKELHEYFDLFLKNTPNDFIEKTPKIRWSALQFGDRAAIDNIPYSDFPIPSTEYKEFFLHNNTLNSSPADSPATVTYNTEDSHSIADFTLKFQEKTRLIGLPKAILYMSAPDHNDMNVFVHLRKRAKEGELLLHLCFPFHAAPVNSIAEISEKQRQSTNLHTGSVGVLRASHRAFDPKRSIHPNFPFHPHEKEEKITPGEAISVQISGQFPSIAEYKAWSEPRPEHERNKGEHQIHVGPEHPSSIILPFVPL
ncbi:putative Galactose-binding-like domain superfamily, xaa-Pro dipeptidyl-peptidase [Septoria linicola]|nr:putative Galactose-binding-like domain superfamily, xaa-Pro dipeptidyl-peptidase [Septoria linicola]